MRDPAVAEQMELIAAALHKRASAVERLGADRWKLTLQNGKPFTVEVWHDAGWLVATADVVDLTPAHYWDLLHLNGQAEALVRFALSPSRGTAGVRLEIPLADDHDEEAAASARHVAALCAGFEKAMGLLDGQTEVARKAPAGAAAGEPDRMATLGTRPVKGIPWRWYSPH